MENNTRLPTQNDSNLPTVAALPTALPIQNDGVNPVITTAFPQSSVMFRMGGPGVRCGSRAVTEEDLHNIQQNRQNMKAYKSSCQIS